MESILRLFDPAGFPARWQCGSGWTETPWLGWLHVFSDLGVWSAYLAIPLVLVYFLLRRRDLPFRMVFLLFGAFILACGTTHLMEAVIFWWPVYRLAGLIKLLTALISWATVFALFQVVPGVLTMRSPEELKREIAGRKLAEEKLQILNGELEKRVQQRTKDLTLVADALRESELREKQRATLLETVLRATPTPIWISHDAECRFITGNPASYRLLEMQEGSNISATSQESIDRTFREYHNGLPVPSDELPLQKAAFKGVEVEGAEFSVVIADAKVRHLYGNATPIRDRDGSVQGAVAAFVDITELKNSEQALKEMDRRKNEFLATLAHELRNPLAPIRNSLEVLKNPERTSEIVAQTYSVMERQVSHMIRLVDDLIDVSRVSRNRLELRHEPVELASIICDAVDTCRPLAEASRHELIISIPEEPIPLNADPTRLVQVVGNLLANSCKYTENGGRIWLTVERDHDDAVIRVRDTGIGIPPEMLSTIFEMFVQADQSLERSRTGLGIGLTLVKRLVELHGGTVTAFSQGPNQGSEFVVRLPVARVGESHDRPRGNHDQDPNLPIPSQRILVVDDNRDSAVTMEMLLKFLGSETHVAYDGAAAIEAAESFRPDMILLDIGLPLINGYDVCRYIRSQSWSKGIAIVAMTGWGQERDRQSSLEAGFDHHLVKPIDAEILKKLLRERSTT